MADVCVVFKNWFDGDNDESVQNLVGVFLDADAAEAEVHRRNAALKAKRKAESDALAAWNAAFRRHGPRDFCEREAWLAHDAYNRTVRPNGPRRCIPPDVQALIDDYRARHAAFDAQYGPQPERTVDEGIWYFAIRVQADAWGVEVDEGAAYKWRPKDD